jgi:hypothetical protein
MQPWRAGLFRFLLGVMFFAMSPAFAEPPPTIRIISEAETVFDWSRQRCDDLWIPDSAARAFRRRDGSIVVIAAHYTNGILEGPDFRSLRPNCAVAAKGSENPDPAAFDDRYWVQALAPAPDGTVIGIVSHEYLGARHVGRCAAPARRGPRCWYSSLLLARADERTLAFRLLPERQRVLAATPAPFDPRTDARVGFFTTSNIVRAGDWYYSVSWVELPQLRGNCLFRAPAGDPVSGWAGLRNGRFDAIFPGAHAAGGDGRSCDVIGRGSLRNILRSVVWLESARRWVGVFIMPRGHGIPEGAYYAMSSDLITWSEPRLLWSTEARADARGCRTVYQYPSLIDHGSTSRLFDTAASDLHLYLTRFNQESCQRDLNRDLIRLRVSAE